MAPTTKKFIFGPQLVVLTLLATVLTILLPILQVVSWINENAVWSLWVSIVVLVVTVMLLVGRLAAVNDAARTAEAETRSAERRVEAAEAQSKKASAALKEMQSTALSDAPAGLSEFDRALADQLLTYASDPDLLTMLGDFFEYQIPHEPVRLIDELSRLPLTRRASDPALAQQLGTLAESAEDWRQRLALVARTDGDYFTTKLDRYIPDVAHREHRENARALVRAGEELHAKLLAYQVYFSSL